MPNSWCQLPLGDNLVVNGDFEDGKTGFESQYTYYTSTLGNQGGCKYCIDTDASNHYGQGNNQPWKGNGNNGHGQYDTYSKFLMASGGNASKYVWQQTVDVKPNTDYKFSAWICHLYKSFGGTYAATVKFCINDVELGTLQTPGHRNGYIEFTDSWNSGNFATAKISIYDTNPSDEAGNDFGLDDISLREVLVMGPISRIAPVCAGSPLTLTPPELYCNGCSGQWEIFQGDDVYETLTTNNPLASSGWNGKFLRYAVNYQGVLCYSNAVQLYVTSGLNVNIQIVDDDATICEDDTAHLQANVTGDVMDFDFIRIGDILCTDGSIVHNADWASSGKIAKGIVFYVDETDVHGWAIGLTEIVSVKWSNNTGNVTGLQPYQNARDAIMDFQGQENTDHISSEQYPAAWYCISEGGYLPAVGQLNMLMGGLVKVNSSLSLVGGTAFATTGNGWYLLSSTVKNNTDVYYIDRSGIIQAGSKTYTGGAYSAKRVARAVFDF